MSLPQNSVRVCVFVCVVVCVVVCVYEPAAEQEQKVCQYQGAGLDFFFTCKPVRKRDYTITNLTLPRYQHTITITNLIRTINTL